MIEIKNANKTYTTPTSTTEALKNINIKLPNTGLILLCGESGSGKTTLLNCIGGLDKLSSGSITGNSKENCSLIFQDFQLLEHSSIYDNLFICQSITKNHLSIDECLKKVSLDVDIHKNVNQLSGGQKQRVAIARALILNRNILLADEPTGNLDSKTSKEIAALLKEISKEKLVIVVSHDKNLFSNFADRQIELLDGSIIRDEVINEPRTDIQKKVQNNFVDKLKFGVVRKIVHSQSQKNISKNITSFIIVFLTIISITTAFQIIFNTKAKSILTAAKEANYSTVNFYYNNNDIPEPIDESKIESVKNIINNNYVTYHSGELNVTLTPDDESSKKVNYYLGDCFNININAGSNFLNSDEIIVSYNFAEFLRSLSATDSNEKLIGKTIYIESYPIKIAGVEGKINTEINYDLDNNFINYIYLTKLTFNNIIEYSSNQNSLNFSTDTTNLAIEKYNDSISITHGKAPLKDNEIALPENQYYNLTKEKDLSNLGTQIINFAFKNDYSPNHTINKKFVVVGISDNYCVNSSTLNSLYKSSNKYFDITGETFLGIYVCDLSTSTINKLDSLNIKYYIPISSSIDEGYHYLQMISYILLLLVIPFTIVLIIHQTSYTNQNIIDKKREIGILKSMSISNKQISKLLIHEPILIFLASAVCSIISGPLLINITNSLLLNRGFKVKLLSYNPIFISISFIILILIIAITTLINIKRLNKIQDIDLVYER